MTQVEQAHADRYASPMNVGVAELKRRFGHYVKLLYEGRRFKVIRGMGSLAAMQEGSADRYFQEGEMSATKLVPEGIEGRVPYKGPVADVVFQMVGGLRSGMGYCGVATIGELHSETELVKITGAGLRESHPHDVTITREAPNYSP